MPELLWQAPHVVWRQVALPDGVGARGSFLPLFSLKPPERERRTAVVEGCPEMSRREQALAAGELRLVGP